MSEKKPTPLPEHQDIQPNDQPPEPPTWAHQEVAASRTKPTRKFQLRDRCTLYLDPEVNQQLDLVAGIERRQRSQVVTELLRQYLPDYQVQRR